MDFLFGSFLTWLPWIFWWLVFVIIGFLYFFRNNKEFILNKLPNFLNFNFLVKSSIIFRIFYAALLTFGQYYIWAHDSFGRILLNSPIKESLPISFIYQLPKIFNQPIGYFFVYSWGRFWLNVIVSIGLAFLFLWFLKFLKKTKERFFEEGEIELGFLGMLIVGWPNQLLYIVFVFALVVVFSIFRQLFLKKQLTTLGWPIVSSVLIILLFGSWLIEFFCLSLFFV
ncbi:MAG: hypothetical protein QMD50_00405 [Patescibacteria group bacterium]|nr:hypothetical protein [Patescibacteria group bacterium]